MADSIREKILARFATNLATVTGIGTPARVYRSRGEAVARDKAPCVLLEWDRESPGEARDVYADRTLSVLVRVHTRGAAPDTLADPIMQAAHAAIMGDPTVNGNAIDVAQGETSFEFEDADKTAGTLTQIYEVMYRHSIANLATAPN